MDCKENTKRRSKTYRRIIGHSVPLKTFEQINLNTNDQNRKNVVSFVDKFLPDHSEMKHWENGVDYSLKKNGRWKMLEKVKEVWQYQDQELASLDGDVTIDHLYVNVHKHQDDHFSQRFRNHGEIVQKSRIKKGAKSKSGKRKRWLEEWEDGDPSKVEIIKTVKPNRSYKRFNKVDNLNDINIQIVSKSSASDTCPKKTPLRCHASDKYTRRTSCALAFMRSRTKHGPNERMARKIVNASNDYTEYDEEDEEIFISSTRNLTDKGFQVQLMDLIIPPKGVKTKKKRAESLFKKEQKKSKIIYVLGNNYSRTSAVINNQPNMIDEDEEILIDDINFDEISMDSLDIPLNSEWKVACSMSTPKICEFWKGKTSLMFILTSRHTALIQISGVDYTSEGHEESIAKICEKIDKEPKNMNPVDQDKPNQIDFYHSRVAQRYLTVEGPQECDVIDLGRMETADTDHWGTQECDICLSECRPLVPSCGHAYCAPCWRRWLSSPGGRSAQCPHPACSATLDIVTHHWLAGPRLFQETRANMLTSRLASDPAVLRCRRCRRVARRRDLSVTRVRCVCGAGSCVTCGQEDHWPASCAELASYTRFSAVFSDLRKLEEEVKVRACPMCGLLWEKMWGCNHMRCGQCHTEFCWGCGQDRGSHPGYWCGHITTPLETRTITPLPTEMTVMKQIELFILAKFVRNKMKKDIRLNIGTLLPKNTHGVQGRGFILWIQTVVETYNCSKQIINYALIRERTLKSKKLISNLKSGIASLTHLTELLKETKQYESDHWRNLVKLHVHNVNLAIKSVCKRC